LPKPRTWRSIDRRSKWPSEWIHRKHRILLKISMIILFKKSFS
jgi:hypothetical protein